MKLAVDSMRMIQCVYDHVISDVHLLNSINPAY